MMPGYFLLSHSVVQTPLELAVMMLLLQPPECLAQGVVGVGR